MGSPDRFDRVGTIVTRHRRPVILIWLVVVAGLAVGFAGTFSDNLTAGAELTPGSESARVQEMLLERFGLSEFEQDLVVFDSGTATVDDPAYAAVIEAVASELIGHEGVIGVTSPLSPAGAPQISADGHAAYVAVEVAGSATERQELATQLAGVVAEVDVDGDDIDVWLTGESPLVADIDAVAQDDLARAETIGLPLALLVLFLAFGAFVAAGLPLVLGGVGIAASFGILGVLSHVTEFNLLTENITTLIGLGVGIDFAMFMVARFREALADGHPAESAARVAVRTSGRSVVFSGVTTIIAMSGLFLVNSPIFHDLAIAVMVTVAVMVAAAVTLLPAVLASVGRHINRGRLRWQRPRGTDADGRWARVAAAVMRRPALVAVSVGVVLLTLAAPATGLELGMSTGTDAVADRASGRGLAVLEEHFSEGAISPVEVVVTPVDGVLDTEVGVVDALVRDLEADPGVTAAGIDLLTPAGAYISAIPLPAVDSNDADALVHRIRDEVVPAREDARVDIAVGGFTAGVIDQTDEMAAKLPIVIAFVLSVTFGLLLLVFRSPALALKAIVMNLASVGAAYGLVVLVFQNGVGESVFGFESPGYIQSYLPLFAFVVLFGISMDYELFLLGRMREEWQRHGDNTAAVTAGMQHTARPITSAAAIQAAIFGAFAFTTVIDVQQVGFALATAILIDATIVRALLVPASMKLMGRWNWWTPAWLDRSLPTVAVE